MNLAISTPNSLHMGWISGPTLSAGLGWISGLPVGLVVLPCLRAWVEVYPMAIMSIYLSENRIGVVFSYD